MKRLSIAFINAEIENDIQENNWFDMFAESDNYWTRLENEYNDYCNEIKRHNNWEIEVYEGCCRYGIEPAPMYLKHAYSFRDWLNIRNEKLVGVKGFPVVHSFYHRMVTRDPMVAYREA